ADQEQLGLGADQREAILASMSAVDYQRRERGREPVVVARVLARADRIEVLPVTGEAVDMAGWADPSALVFEGWEQASRDGWADLARRRPGLIAALARQAG